MVFEIVFNQTALFLAVEKNNIEIIKLLLTNKDISINIPCILNIDYK